jgi:Cof subfamily protein (haloacid dehalogenase superfamily)
MFRSARQIAARLGFNEPLVCYQGALVQHAITGEVLYHRTVPLALAHEIIKDVESRGLHLNVYLEDDIYVREVTPEALYYSRINMDMPLNAVGALGPWLETRNGVEPTKLVIVTDPSETDSTLAEFAAIYGERLQVTKSHPRFTEFTNIECSKGRALAFLASYYGVEREEVMAIGDGLNDRDMLEWAGCGVAMATSPREVLDAARFRTLSLAEDGAALAIEEHVLSAR